LHIARGDGSSNSDIGGVANKKKAGQRGFREKRRKVLGTTKDGTWEQRRRKVSGLLREETQKKEMVKRKKSGDVKSGDKRESETTTPHPWAKGAMRLVNRNDSIFGRRKTGGKRAVNEVKKSWHTFPIRTRSRGERGKIGSKLTIRQNAAIDSTKARRI